METWIEFRQVPKEPNRKTDIFQVVAKQGGFILGDIKWYGAWRRYCFFVAASTIFEQDCLRNIASFCEQRTQEHRNRAAA
jgi:hypothetical protein